MFVFVFVLVLVDAPRLLDSIHPYYLSFLLHSIHHAKLNSEDLVVTAIHFTIASKSVPHDLMMSVMRQAGFPEWTRQIAADMYESAPSIIEMREEQSDKIGWKRRVKQGCPLS
jgi:hypothetical protein